jgi:endonuclease YncB( thermonuclease family)
VRQLLIVVLALAFATAGPACADFDGRVVDVHDGDTLTVLADQKQIRVRLADIDAPERGQAFGWRSTQSLAGMCAGEEAHVAEQRKDRYGHVLGRVTCGRYDANAEQVRRGFAWVSTRYAPKDSPLYSVQTAARLERRGLWIDRVSMAPWEWRLRQRAKTSQPQL